jgi:hypothetical protein
MSYGSPVNAGPVYTASFSATTTTTNPYDVFGILPSTASQVLIHEIVLGNVSTGPAAEAIGMTLLRGSTASSTSAALTSRDQRGYTGTPTAGSSVTAPSSTLVSTTSAVLLHADSWVYGQGSWKFCPEECERPLLALSQRLHLRMSAPAAGLSLYGTIKFSEPGKYPS